MKKKQILIVGGGAAGYFAALESARINKDSQITISEAASKPLSKLAISGGGRCNVTHACDDIDTLLEGYPRGRKELKSAFSRFQVKDTISWFKERGVILKKENDGRMFPVTDNSQTIIDCFEKYRLKLNIKLRLKTKVKSIDINKNNLFEVTYSNLEKKIFDCILLATGSASSGYKVAESLGHNIKKCVPSLFTFKVDDLLLKDLSGISVQGGHIVLKLAKKKFHTQGPILVTHWGLSGPAIIKLSAFAAKELFENNYSAELIINWAPQINDESFKQKLLQHKKQHPKQKIYKHPFIPLPKRLWLNICKSAEISEQLIYCQLSKEETQKLKRKIHQCPLNVNGKGVFKEEFVTCGGVSLKEVDFRTMQSKIVKGLYFAGEILDIDGITGGYNFQNAWTTGYIVGNSI